MQGIAAARRVAEDYGAGKVCLATLAIECTAIPTVPIAGKIMKQSRGNDGNWVVYYIDCASIPACATATQGHAVESCFPVFRKDAAPVFQGRVTSKRGIGDH